MTDWSEETKARLRELGRGWKAPTLLKSIAIAALARIEELEREITFLKKDRDRFQSIVHAVSPILDPSSLGKTAEQFGASARRMAAEIERLKRDREAGEAHDVVTPGRPTRRGVMAGPGCRGIRCGGCGEPLRECRCRPLCECVPCETCGMKHSCNLNAPHPGGWVRVGNECPPIKQQWGLRGGDR